MLPFDSSLIFVLDDPISSKGSKPGALVRVHLKNALVVAGQTLAPAGTPAKIRILNAEAAHSGDVYGYVNIYFLPLMLPDGRELPLRAPTSHLSATTTAGHEATVETEDTVEDVVIPYHYLYQIFRKGRNFELGPGAEIRARTQATITTLASGAVVISTPQPFAIDTDMPQSAFPVHALATPKPLGTPRSATAPPLQPEHPYPGETPPR